MKKPSKRSLIEEHVDRLIALLINPHDFQRPEVSAEVRERREAIGKLLA